MSLKQAEVTQAFGRLDNRRFDGARTPAQLVAGPVVVDDRTRAVLSCRQPDTPQALEGKREQPAGFLVGRTITDPTQTRRPGRS